MAQNKKLLVVDDDLISCQELLSKTLAFKGIEVTVAEDIESAIAVIKNNQFDLIVIDLSLKASDSGLELVKKIRALDKTVRIAILTGHGDKYRSQALELGANYYFSKPIDFKKHFFEPLGIEQ